MTCITLDYGADDPLVLEFGDGALVACCRGPEGVVGEQAGLQVAAAIAMPVEGPPLGTHVVPGDRVAIAVSGCVPQAGAAVAAVVEALVAAGVQAADISILRAPALPLVASDGATQPFGVSRGENAVEFDPADESQTAYIAADASGRPIHVARALVDADVVVAVGGWTWDAALGGRGLDGEVWPAFSRHGCRQELLRSLASRGRRGLRRWKAGCREAVWQLGLAASLRVVGGRQATLLAAAFGPPDEVARKSRALAAGWRPSVARPAALTVASLSESAGSPAVVLRAVAAAARVTHPAGTICVASRMTESPGVIFTRWREGAPLGRLVREALETKDQSLIADAFLTRFFARAIGERRLVLLSELDESTVEGLELGYAASPEVVERLAHRAESVIVLEEADRMLPRVGDGSSG